MSEQSQAPKAKANKRRFAPISFFKGEAAQAAETEERRLVQAARLAEPRPEQEREKQVPQRLFDSLRSVPNCGEAWIAAST